MPPASAPTSGAATSDLAGFGYDESLKRELSFWSAFGLAFAFISPMIGLYGMFALGIGAGGPAFWWAFPIVLVGQLIVAGVLAELSSKWPLAGGVSMWSRQLLGSGFGWFAGWAYIWTLVMASAVTAYGAAGFLAALIGIDVTTTSQVLIALVLLGFATLANTGGRKYLTYLVIASIVCELLGSWVTGALLLLFHREHGLGVLFENRVNDGSFLGPLLTSVAFVGWSFVGFESAGAISEEVADPKRDVPKAIILSLIVVASTIMFAGLAVILAIPDLGAAIAGNDADPVTSTLTTALGTGISKPLFAVIVIGFTAGLVALQAAVSRTIFSMARDRSLPRSETLAKVSDSDRLPINAILLAAALTGIVLALAGTQVYGTLISFATGGFYVAFSFPVIGALVLRARGTWEPGSWSLGRFGLAINVLAALWLAFQVINIAWPRTPDLPWYQNYGVILTLGGLAIVGVAVYARMQSQIRPVSRHEQAVAEGVVGA